MALALGLGRRQIRRIMHLFGIKPYKRKARWRKRQDERRAPAPYLNQIKDLCLQAPDHVWTSDFTYLKFKKQYVYLATVMDLYTREIIGWHLSLRHTQELTITALKDALATRQLKKPKFIHSDQGSEYLAKEYIRFAKEWQIQISMSRKASPWENGYQESFYNNFKTDLGLEFDRFNTTGEFIEAVHQTISYYNQRRIHTRLKTTPTKFYKQHLLENMSKKTET